MRLPWYRCANRHQHPSPKEREQKKNRTVHTKIAHSLHVLVWKIFIIFFMVDHSGVSRVALKVFHFTIVTPNFFGQQKNCNVFISQLSDSLTKNSLVNVITILAIWRDKKKLLLLKTSHKKWTLHLNMFGFLLLTLFFCCCVFVAGVWLPSKHADRNCVVANTTIAFFFLF